MAQTPEGKVKAQVKAILKRFGAYQFWPVQTGFGATTVDCLCCIDGKFLAIEVKAKAGKLTPRQELTLREVSKAGGLACIVGGKYLSPEGFEAWLTMTLGRGP